METYWVNKSQDIVPDVQMHLYMNAFRSNKTTFYKESGRTADKRDLILDGLILRISLTETGKICFLICSLSGLMMEICMTALF